MTLKEAALEYAQMGWPIFPCKPRSKEPAVKGWNTLASTDPVTISQWWDSNPNYNIGYPTGEKTVVDCDISLEKGKDGSARISRWEQENGRMLQRNTATARTGGGGTQQFYCSDAGETFKNAVDLFGDNSGVDIRGAGGYVVLPPSIHPNGNRYEWIKHPTIFGAAPIDDDLRALLAGKERQNAQSYTPRMQLPDLIGEGQRNNILFRLACALVSKGLSKDAVVAAVRAENDARCVPPVDDAELNTILASAFRYPSGTNSYSETLPDWAAAREGFAALAEEEKAWKLIPAEEIKYTPPDWLIENYILRGKLNLIQGDSGAGKTALAMYLAACVSAGKPFCKTDKTIIGNTLILSVEDDAGVLRGRLEANGADLQKCFFAPEGILPDLSFNHPAIEKMIHEYGIDLVIFDPLQMFLGAKVDMHRANETRPVLTKLAEMAGRQNCAVVIISHTGKVAKDKAAVNRSLGSVDIVAAMRTALHVLRDPSDKDTVLAVPVKNNASEWGKAFKYQIGERAAVHFTGYIDLTVEEAEAIRKRSESKCPYEEEPIVITLRAIVQKNPSGGKFSYSEVREAGFEALGGMPLCADNNDIKRMICPLVNELQRIDGFEVATGIKTSNGNSRGISIKVHKKAGA